MLNGKRVLLVLNKVSDARQVDDALPENHNLGRNRVLCISQLPLDGLRVPFHAHALGPFTEAEALAVFEKVLGQDVIAQQGDTLREISQRLDRAPALIMNAARTLAEGTQTLNGYLRLLRDQAGAGQLLRQTGSETLALMAAGLTPDRAELLEDTGLLGDGDWDAAMLAAVALRPATEVKPILGALVRSGLVNVADNGRYSVTSIVREYAKSRLAQRPSFALRAAQHLLARYCLDRTQDIEARLRGRPDLRAASDGSDAVHQRVARDKAFALAFREALQADWPHVRHVLDWALECETWNVILRFSYLPYMGLVHHLVAQRARLLRAAFTMAIIRAPVVVPRGEARVIIADSIGSAENWTIDMTRVRDDETCDLELNLTASRIYDGLFERVNLVDINWVGVRAGRLLLKRCDLVGGRIVGSDLNHAVLLTCDARHANFAGTNLSYAFLKDVNLRGANLRGVNLTGAVLDHVDLRGADLTWANLSAARVIHVRLDGSRLDGVIWAGLSGTLTATDESLRLQLDEINQAAREHPQNVAESPYGWVPDQRESPPNGLSGRRLLTPDLRGVDWTGAQLVRTQARLRPTRAVAGWPMSRPMRLYSVTPHCAAPIWPERT